MSTLARSSFFAFALCPRFSDSGSTEALSRLTTTSRTNKLITSEVSVVASAIGSGRRRRRGTGGTGSGDGNGGKTPASGQRTKWLPETSNAEASELQDRSHNSLQDAAEQPYVDDAEVLYLDDVGRQAEGSRGDRELKALDREVARAAAQFDAEEIVKAKRLVADLIRSGEDIEQVRLIEAITPLLLLLAAACGGSRCE